MPFYAMAAFYSISSSIGVLYRSALRLPPIYCIDWFYSWLPCFEKIIGIMQAYLYQIHPLNLFLYFFMLQ